MHSYSQYREQLERLHDHHKRLSLEVYDHLNAKEEKKMIKAHKEFKKVENELETLKNKLHPKI